MATVGTIQHSRSMRSVVYSIRQMYDVIVVGLGIYGACIVDALGERGLRVAGVDQYVFPNSEGSSHGNSRIIRQTTLEDESYVGVMRDALDLWEHADSSTNGALLVNSGLSIISEPGTRSQQHHGVAGVVHRAARLARKYDIPFETLNGAQYSDRYPGLSLPPKSEIFLELNAKIVRPEIAVSYYLDRSRGRSTTDIVHGQQVSNVSKARGRGGLRVNLGKDTLSTRKVVLATGPWQHKRILGFPAVRASVFPQAVLTTRDAIPSLGGLPPFVYLRNGADLVYGIPASDSLQETKFATEQYDIKFEEQTTLSDIAAKSLRDRTLVGIAHVAPEAALATFESTSCSYTVTSRNKLVVKRVPQIPDVTVVSACSGHGFKYAPAIGQRVAERLLSEIR